MPPLLPTRVVAVLAHGPACGGSAPAPGTTSSLVARTRRRPDAAPALRRRRERCHRRDRRPETADLFMRTPRVEPAPGYGGGAEGSMSRVDHFPAAFFGACNRARE